MDPSFVTQAAGLRSARAGQAVLSLTMVAFAAYGFVAGAWLLGIAMLAAGASTYTLAHAWTAVRFEVHSDRVVAVRPWGSSSISLNRVASVRAASIWDSYRYFLSAHFETDLKHLVVMPPQRGLLRTGWLLSPQDREGFIEAVNTALARYRRVHGSPV